MRARHKATPRTDEERAARRASEADYRARLDQPVAPELIQAIKGARRELDHASDPDLRGIARVYLASSEPGRRHRVHKGAFSIHSQELEGAFGRGRFKQLATEHRIATVVGDWGLGTTEAWKLDEDFARCVGDAIAVSNHEAIAAISAAPLELRTRFKPKRWSARDHLQGLPRSLLGTATLTPVVPINLPALLQLDTILMDLQRAPADEQMRRFGSLKIDPDADLSYYINVLRQVIYYARHDAEGPGYMTHWYVMKPTGRVFARWPGLQSVPKVIKRFALLDAFVYDFDNCHFTIIQQLVTELGHDCPALSHYLAFKKEVRQAIADDVGITVAQVKRCLIALGYGASITEWGDAAIPKAIGREAARRLYGHPLFRSLHDELEALRPLILDRFTTRKGVLRNAMGLAFDEEARRLEGGSLDAKRQAHVLQGIEALVLLLVYRAYPDDILLLEHDGFVCRREIPTEEIERLVRVETARIVETGLSLKLTCERNTMPAERGTSRAAA